MVAYQCEQHVGHRFAREDVFLGMVRHGFELAMLLNDGGLLR